MKLILTLLLPVVSLFGQEGTFINPITDVCWSCLFPMHIAGANVTPSHPSFSSHPQKFCHCPGGLIGLPWAFWEPSRLIEVTRTPYKFHGLGGLTLGNCDVKKKGMVTSSQGRGRSSFYHVHYYLYPLLKILDLSKDLICTETFDLDIAYMSELDPFWGDEKWTAILHPEVLLYANPLAQSACIFDGLSATFNKPLDKLYWCAGCHGSLYPFIGHITHHIGSIQSSSLLVHRLLAKLHALGTLKGYAPDNFCEKERFLHIKKSLYKTQLIYPVAQTKGPCNPLGKSDVLWGAGKTYPYGGEDFVYLIWTKRQCCLDPAKIALELSGVTP